MLDYFALFLLFFVVVTLFYGIIAIHDIPYEIAKARNHPHQDAIHVTGWISLLTLHVLWPFLWIWATLYRPDRGWGMMSATKSGEDQAAILQREIDGLKTHLAQLEQRLNQPDAELRTRLAQLEERINKQTVAKE
jgi:hypothetical protein